jgi:hypothetical protein
MNLGFYALVSTTASKLFVKLKTSENFNTGKVYLKNYELEMSHVVAMGEMNK